jgi:hypothetical protein
LGKSQLPASHLSIRSTPEVITHCAPFIVVADLHTSSSGSASLKSDGSLSAHYGVVKVANEKEEGEI